VNFALWGLWHGLGLFGHNRWSEWLKNRTALRPAQKPESSPQGAASQGREGRGSSRLLGWGGIFVTFNYVSLGWVFFALPTINAARHFFGVLFGLA
jgi:D-alanyl-lipoteichoic acid acyltransferase DltB (MBOAT superfamily)